MLLKRYEKSLEQRSSDRSGIEKSAVAFVCICCLDGVEFAYALQEARDRLELDKSQVSRIKGTSQYLLGELKRTGAAAEQAEIERLAAQLNTRNFYADGTPKVRIAAGLAPLESTLHAAIDSIELLREAERDGHAHAAKALKALSSLLRGASKPEALRIFHG